MSTATMTRPTVPAAVRPEVRPDPRVSRPAMPAGLRIEPVRAAAPVAPGRLRITRRGRLVLVVLCSLVLLALISVGRTGSQAATSTDIGPSLQQTTVQPGETLWAVAQRIAPDNDPREVVAQIRRINHLKSSSLRAGEQLLLPVAAR